MSLIKSVTSRSLGKLISYNKKANGFEGIAENGRFKVTAFSSTIINITITQEDFFENFSYSVVASPHEVKFELIEEPDQIILQTDELKLILVKNPIRFAFYNKEDALLNEDDPGLGTAWIGEQVTSYKKLQEEERFIGLGEKTGPLDRRGSSYQNWNTDAYGYGSGTDPLYCSTPFYMGIHHQLVYGIFLDNTHKTFFNFGASNNRFSSFSADMGEMNYYFIHGETVKDIIRNYTWLTGRMEMPPLWSIGYQQCRYSYYPDKEIVNIARTFREKEIPADVIVLDIHYMEKYKIFTWDKKNFSNPKALIDHLRELGFRVVIMCDPGIKVEEGYETYDDGLKQDVFIKYPDGSNYHGQVWPGWCHFPDFTNPKTREWWASKFNSYVDLGIEGFWNDMNEIATWGHALPENLEFDFEGNKATTRRGRNIFGFQMARSTYEGTKRLLKGRRPFNLTRSGFSGVQRYSAVWTGDNVSYDEHMLLGVRMVSSLGMTGISFAGYDTGGFVGEASTKLFARWISIATFSPFFRAHTMINTRDSEPWSYGEEVEQICRNYISLRYQLLPYIYSLFYHSAQTGEPIQRSLAVDYTFSSNTYNHLYHNQYLFGPNILVAPVESNRDLLRIYLPEGEWYYLFNGKKYQGNQEIVVETPIHKLPVFIKGGSVLPMQKTISSTNIKPEELILHIYNGASSEFVFYQDDGTTFDYQKGDFAKRNIRFDFQERKIVISQTEGRYPSPLKKITLMLHGFDELQHITIENQKLDLLNMNHSFFTPLEKYDPIHDPDRFGEENIKTITIGYTKEEAIFTW
jgi:alpha-glucosidase